MSSAITRAVVCAVVLALATAVATQAPAPVQLAVPGRASANVWLAASGKRVAAVWGARAADGTTDVYLATSGDGGRTFASPVRVNDRQGVRINGETAPHVTFAERRGQAPAIDVLWVARDSATTIRMARSVDGGRTFGASRELQTPGAAGDRGWATMTSDARGVTQALWLDHRGMAAQRAAMQAAMAAGQGMAHQHAAAGEGDDAGASGSAVYYFDGTKERPITASVCYCCKTALAVGPDGTIFAAWRHVYPGNFRDIAMAASTDGGRMFGPVSRVSEDHWQLNGCPEDGPSVAVDPTGTAHIVWPTVVTEPVPHKALFYATTRNGRTFSARARVSSPPRNIDHPQIVVGPGGEAAIFWDEVVSGHRRVFLSRKDWEGQFGMAEQVSDATEASYPMGVFSDGGVVVAWTEGIGSNTHITVRRLPGRMP